MVKNFRENIEDVDIKPKAKPRVSVLVVDASTNRVEEEQLYKAYNIKPHKSRLFVDLSDPDREVCEVLAEEQIIEADLQDIRDVVIALNEDHEKLNTLKYGLVGLEDHLSQDFEVTHYHRKSRDFVEKAVHKNPPKKRAAAARSM